MKFIQHLTTVSQELDAFRLSCEGTGGRKTEGETELLLLSRHCRICNYRLTTIFHTK